MPIATRPVNRRPATPNDPHFHIFYPPQTGPDAGPPQNGAENLSLWSNNNIIPMGEVLGYDPDMKFVPDYAPPGGYVKNIRKPRTLAATLADSDQVQILTDLAKANAKVIAQRQHAAGFWRGFGPYDSSLYGPRSMGGSVSWLGLQYYHDQEGATNLGSLPVRDILALFAHPADACNETDPDDLTQQVKVPGRNPVTPIIVPRSRYTWWTANGRALTKWFFGLLADELKAACDTFVPPGGTSVVPLCYPSHWLFDTEAFPDPRLFWEPAVSGSTVTQIGIFRNMTTLNAGNPVDGRYGVSANDGEPITRLSGVDRSLRWLWENRPTGVELPPFGGGVTDDIEFRQWVNRLSVETQAWAMADAIQTPLAAVFPGVQVSDYDRVLAPNPSKPYIPGNNPTEQTERFNTFHLGLNCQSPLLYPKTGERLLDSHLARVRRLMSACDPSVPIIPWIAHPDTPPRSIDTSGSWYGTREHFLRTVSVCCNEYGVRDFGLWGFPPTLGYEYDNWDSAALPALVNEALRRVATPPLTPNQILLDLLDGLELHTVA